MEVQSKGKDRDLTLTFFGELDHHGAHDTVIRMERALDAALPLKLTLDFSGVTFMDSSGIAVVMRAHRRMAALGGRLEVVRVPEQAKKVFDAAGLAGRISIEGAQK